MTTTLDLREVLDRALDDEFAARATYEAVIGRFGPLRPFSRIRESEERHIAALLALYARYEIEPPDDDWRGHVDAPASLEEACRRGVEAERDNAALYDELLAATDAPDVRAVLSDLRRASQQNHLPAFERCLERRARGGRGRGARSHGGWGGHRGGRCTPD